MIFLIHRTSDLAIVKQDILPLIPVPFERTSYPVPENFQPQEKDLVFMYLSDEDLSTFLPQTRKFPCPVSLLPHPGSDYIFKGLGITGGLEKVIHDIMEAEPQHLDILCCNGYPVFQSMYVGDVFLLKKEEHRNTIFSEFWHVLRNIYHAYSLDHKEFYLSSDNQKIIRTAAMGIIVVEHARDSLISNRLPLSDSKTDGTFNSLILAPKNLLQLFMFLIRSLIPRKKSLNRYPSFIGSIVTGNLTIRCPESFDYVIDGKVATANELFLGIQEKNLFLKQKSSRLGRREGKMSNHSVKVQGLPTGQLREDLLKHRIPFLPHATSDQFQDLFKVLRENAVLTRPFVILIILSTLISAFGLFADSSSVIIGAMVLAPIISPIISFSMGMVRYDLEILKSSGKTVFTGTWVSLACGAGLSVLIPIESLTDEIAARLSPNLLDLGVAIVSGIAAAYAHAEESLAKRLAGVAIAVALVPPLTVSGIGIGWWNWEIFSGSFLLYLTNLSGIILFSGLTFLLMGFAPFKRAKTGLVYTLIIVVLIAVPLSFSFQRIIKKANITGKLEGSVIETVVLRDIKIRFGKPMVISLKLIGTEAMEPEKVARIKKEIEKRVGQPIALEVVSAIEY